MKKRMTFSRHCKYCAGNKKLHRQDYVPTLTRLLREAATFIDGSTAEGNEYQFTLKQEIEKLVGTA